MKTLLVLVMLVITSTAGAQRLTETQKLHSLCKVWGFLKYHHSYPNKKGVDWDAELVKKINQLDKLTTAQELKDFYQEWIKELDPLRIKPKRSPLGPNIQYLCDFNWLKDTTCFKLESSLQLQFIYQNRYNRNTQNKSGKSSFADEKQYKDSVYCHKQGRLLTLFRYWNIMEYFFPYKDKTDLPWDLVLSESIPDFLNASDTLSYHLAIKKLTTRINDSHGFFYSPYIRKYYGTLFPPFRLKFIQQKAVIEFPFNDSICKHFDLQPGDVLLKVDGISIEEKVKALLPYTAGSNSGSQYRDLDMQLLSGNERMATIEIERNGERLTKTMGRYTYNEIHPTWESYKGPSYKELNNEIGYLYMGLLEPKEVKKAMKQFKHTKGLVIDIRNYPKGTAFLVSQYLNKEVKPFVKFSSPIKNNPGIFKMGRCYYTGKKRKINIWYSYRPSRKINRRYYKGKVIVLMNELTQSQAEFTCMAFKTAPNIVFVGSPTAGADGDVVYIPFPGGLSTAFSSYGVYYPNGEETQRIGIKPDVLMYPTVEGIRQGKDELLEKAIELISNTANN